MKQLNIDTRKSAWINAFWEDLAERDGVDLSDIELAYDPPDCVWEE